MAYHQWDDQRLPRPPPPPPPPLPITALNTTGPLIQPEPSLLEGTNSILVYYLSINIFIMATLMYQRFVHRVERPNSLVVVRSFSAKCRCTREETDFSSESQLGRTFTLRHGKDGRSESGRQMKLVRLSKVVLRVVYELDEAILRWYMAQPKQTILVFFFCNAQSKRLFKISLAIQWLLTAKICNQMSLESKFRIDIPR